MTAQIIDGKKSAAELRQKLKNEISAFGASGVISATGATRVSGATSVIGTVPQLAVFLIGDNPASQIYVRNKEKAAAEVGIKCEIIRLPETVDESELEKRIKVLNNDPQVNGILVQLPLPQHLDPLKIIAMIDPRKDVDGFSPCNAGLLQMNNKEAVVAATPRGVLSLLQGTGLDLCGLHALIIGRSNIVGRPLADLLLNQNCTVTVAHSKTTNLEALCRQADIVVAACGCPKMVKGSWIKEGAVVIDVGINRVDGKLCGDVDFDEVKEKAAFLTPVPGGVGPMTIAMLLDNTYQVYLKQHA